MGDHRGQELSWGGGEAWAGEGHTLEHSAFFACDRASQLVAGTSRFYLPQCQPCFNALPYSASSTIFPWLTVTLIPVPTEKPALSSQ